MLKIKATATKKEYTFPLSAEALAEVGALKWKETEIVSGAPVWEYASYEHTLAHINELYQQAQENGPQAEQTAYAIAEAHFARRIALTGKSSRFLDTVISLAETEFFFDEINPAEFAKRERKENALDWLEPEDLEACQSWQEVFDKHINGVYAVPICGGVLICERLYMDYIL